MEVRERRSPRDREMLATVESELPQLKDFDEPLDTANSIPPPSRQLTKQELNWPYPVKPAFPNDDFDDDDDEDDVEEDMAMMTTCCCCFSTKNGSIAVGVICLVIGFLISVVSCFALINADEFQTTLKAYYTNYQQLVAANVTVNGFGIINKMIDVDIILNNLEIVYIAFLVFYSIYTFSALFLTYGACSDLRSLLLPWVVLEFVPFAVQLGGIVITFVYGKDDPILSQGGIYIIAGLVEIVAFVIHVYWWMCPVAHYQNLKEKTEVQPLIPPTHPLYPNVHKY